MLIKTSMSVCLLKKGIGKLWKEVEGEKDRVEDDKISSFCLCGFACCYASIQLRPDCGFVDLFGVFLFFFEKIKLCGIESIISVYENEMDDSLETLIHVLRLNCLLSKVFKGNGRDRHDLFIEKLDLFKQLCV